MPLPIKKAYNCYGGHKNNILLLGKQHFRSLVRTQRSGEAAPVWVALATRTLQRNGTICEDL